MSSSTSRLAKAIMPNAGTKGRFQWWKKPEYVGPYKWPLEVGPDYTFKDGRSVVVTSERQLEYKTDNARIIRDVVARLKDVRTMEMAHQKAEAERSRTEEARRKMRPIAKGNRSI
ncbi:hypothetical protein WR25_09876 [Diploscapter pachys]|uniref:Uncharacterized protein n=1 Tax=Diploscapter pachys TaxID=2018661 RepID=A0A2A2LH88_9BILA|nr:hypothetical protein WR25_09876 [Diploscapter pachys]